MIRIYVYLISFFLSFKIPGYPEIHPIASSRFLLSATTLLRE